MHKPHSCIWVLLSTLLLTLLIPGSPAFSKKWYDYYQEAQRAVQKRDWTTAIKLFEKAIEAEPEPAKRKKFGFRSTSYYPYMELGMAYLATGNIEAAYQYCEQAKQKGVAPQATVDKCLATTTAFLQQLQKPLPASPVPQQQEFPRIQLSSTVPSETEHNTILIQGVAFAENGVDKIRVSIENAGITGINTFMMAKRKEEEFNINVPLDFGRSTITLEVIDTQGNITREELSTIRNTSFASAPTPIPPSAEIPTPTPVPLPTESPDARPVINIVSVIPAETTDTNLLIKGIATDDRGKVDVHVDVRQPGRRGLALGAPLKKEQGSFQITVNLEIGENEIIIEAIDTIGQTTQETVFVTRKALPTPKVTEPTTADVIPDGVIQRPGDVYAVIIGIGNYEDKRIPDLQYTVSDAQGFYDVLIDPNYGGIPKNHIKLLLNEQATDREIKRAIGRWLSRQAKKEDTVIIYYSGHGAPETRETYWVTYNANIDDLYTTALNNNDIADMLDRIESDRVITFLDSCYSAATVKRKVQTRSIQTEIPWEKFSGKGRVAISASDGKQLSLELKQYGHGVFTYYLLEGLKGEADKNLDGIIDVDEIWNYVKYQVSDTARKAGNPQTPVFQGSVTAGIPLTFNLSFLHQKQQEQHSAKKQEQLKQLFEQGLISAKHYNCAYKMLKSGDSNIWLDSLLSGDIDPEVFNDSFECE